MRISIPKFNKSSIKQNVDYNVITWDRENKKLTFTDSENINSEQVVEYVDDDVTISGTKTIIKTTTFGDVEIEDGTLRYFHNLIKNSSYEKEDKSASVTTYKFNKYTYFADLVLGLVENVTLVENAGNYTINLNGTSYTDNTTLGNQVLMTGTSTSVSVNNEEKKYTINCLFENHPRTIELYLNDDNSYKYLVISGTVSNIQYYYIEEYPPCQGIIS